MKITGMLLLVAVLLTGCSSENQELERGLRLRETLLKAEEVSFQADISADYGDSLQLFSMNCQANAGGEIRFEVTAPDTISGITGVLSEKSGMLTFDDVALHFELLTDEQLSPVSAPWILLRSLRSGYLSAAGMEGESLRLTVHDSYEEDALQLDIWLDSQDMPRRAEVLYDGKQILSLDVRAFQIR